MSVGTTWWWIRHAPTHAKKLFGWTDIPADLSDIESLERLSAALPENAVVVSSDLRRASETADAISSGRKRMPNDARLREINFGSWESMEFAEIARLHPDISRKYWTDPSTATPPGGENWESVMDRVSDFVQEFSREQFAEDIVAVSHFGTILTQIQRATGKTGSKAVSRKIEYLSITKIRLLNDGKFMLLT